MKKKITDQEISDAYAKLKAQGKSITLADIRAIVGHGSLSTIQQAVERIEKKSPPDDQVAAEAFKGVWAKAVAVGEARAATKIKELVAALAVAENEAEQLDQKNEEIMQRHKESEQTTGRLALDLTTAHATATTARDAAWPLSSWPGRGHRGMPPPVTGTCRSMPVQENLTRQAPLPRSPNTQRSFLNVLNLPKYRPTIQRFGLSGVAPCGPLVGEFPQVVVQGAERPGGHHAPVVGRPAPDDGVERGDDRHRVAAAQGARLGREPFPDPLDGRLGRLDQQLAVGVAADVEPEEVKALDRGGRSASCPR